MERHKWMYDMPRYENVYFEELSKFLEAAKEHSLSKTSKKILCPRVDCKNKKAWFDTQVIQSHLIRRGFQAGYTIWYKHGVRKLIASVNGQKLNYTQIQLLL